MDDARARLPEADSEFGARRREEVINLKVRSGAWPLILSRSLRAYPRPHLTVDVFGPCQILRTAHFRFDQMVAVNCGGHSHPGQPAADKLEHRHLGSGVLHGHAVRTQLQVAVAANDVLLARLVQVAVQDLFAERQRTVQAGIETARGDDSPGFEFRSLDSPLLHDRQVVFKEVVVDVLVLVKVAHGHLKREKDLNDQIKTKRLFEA